MRKLALLTTMAIAVLAMTAVSASAATQVRNSAGTLCSQVSPAINASNAVFASTTRSYASGGCTIRMSSITPFVIYRSANNTNPTSCHIAFDAHIGGDGWGYAENFVFSSCSNGAVVNQCPGDRMIAPPSYTGGPFTPFSSANAATDLNVELCANAVSINWWGRNSFDIAYPTGSTWHWANQVTTANTSDPSQHFRNGSLSSAGRLTITH